MDSFKKKWESNNLSKKDKSLKSLVLYNDDVNSFDYVIETLCDICDHDDVQAEQCAIITHYKGHCIVKQGTQDELIPLKYQLETKNLLVTLL